MLVCHTSIIPFSVTELSPKPSEHAVDICRNIHISIRRIATCSRWQSLIRPGSIVSGHRSVSGRYSTPPRLTPNGNRASLCSVVTYGNHTPWVPYERYISFSFIPPISLFSSLPPCPSNHPSNQTNPPKINQTPKNPVVYVSWLVLFFFSFSYAAFQPLRSRTKTVVLPFPPSAFSSFLSSSLLHTPPFQPSDHPFVFLSASSSCSSLLL